MEVVTAIANVRATTEREIVESYTHRQLAHIGRTYLKDRLLVLSEVSKGLGAKPADGKKKGRRSLNIRRQPLRPGMKRKVNVIDIDKPIDGATQALLGNIMGSGFSPPKGRR